MMVTTDPFVKPEVSQQLTQFLKADTSIGHSAQDPNQGSFVPAHSNTLARKPLRATFSADSRRLPVNGHDWSEIGIRIVANHRRFSAASITRAALCFHVNRLMTVCLAAAPSRERNDSALAKLSIARASTAVLPGSTSIPFS